MKKSRQTDGEDKSNQDRWLLTYADMITLLLALFIVMYSMSKIDSGKFSDVTNALADQLRGGTTIFEKSLGGDEIAEQQLDQQRLRYLEQKILRRIHNANLERNTPIGITTVVDQRGLVIHIEESTLFDPGKDQLKPRAIVPLDLISDQLKGINNPIRIEGHTDNVPISTPKFPSNWELSTARSISVVRYFVEKHNISPQQLSALGFGEFRPIADNATAKGRAANRRVDIVVLSQTEIFKEPPLEIHELAGVPDSTSK